ncbi:MAG: cellulase family glycosylhydrolase, partial [Lewinella sp.]|nr:cellulase family glycosylhydrolase [Lewinella sp.]
MCRRFQLAVLSFVLILPLAGQDAPFDRGVNLTNWFQANSAQEIPFGKYTLTDFEQIQSLGCDVIRLPINLHAMAGPGPGYTLDPLFLEFLDQAVDWAETVGIHLILDNHTFDPASDTPTDIDDVLLPVWEQMANHFKDRSDLILYEVLNEPHGINDALWGSIQGQVIDRIRSTGDTHTIV